MSDTTYLFFSVGLFFLHDHLTMFVVYCSWELARCLLDSTEVEFSYDADISLVSIILLMPDQELYRWRLEIMV
jgi:hypothetical protein